MAVTTSGVMPYAPGSPRILRAGSTHPFHGGCAPHAADLAASGSRFSNRKRGLKAGGPWTGSLRLCDRRRRPLRDLLVTVVGQSNDLAIWVRLG
jgi:hypothetical protein